MQALINYAKTHKVTVAIIVIIVLVAVYFLWFKAGKSTAKTSASVDKFTTGKSGGKDGKKKIPKVGGSGGKKGKKSKAQKGRDTEIKINMSANSANDDPESDSDQDDGDATTLAKNLYDLLHDDLSNDTLSLEEFKNLSEDKVGSVVYTELVQLYEDKGDPSRVSYRDYLKIVRDHVEK